MSPVLTSTGILQGCCCFGHCGKLCNSTAGPRSPLPDRSIMVYARAEHSVMSQYMVPSQGQVLGNLACVPFLVQDAL